MRLRRCSELPPIELRDWFTEKEAARAIGAAYSTLRGWRYADQLRKREGLPWEGNAPRYYIAGQRNIRYKKEEVRRWIERKSGPDAK